MAFDGADDGGLAVVRVKPLGAGGGGGEVSACEDLVDSALETTPHSIGVKGRIFTYPEHVIEAGVDQQQLYDTFMPRRVDAFLEGCNANIMVYGQTGGGKTHTMFGPPGLMARAASGKLGLFISPEYGLCPRGIMDIFRRVEQMRLNRVDMRYVLAASAVELTFMEGNVDMLLKSKRDKVTGSFGCSSVSGVVLDRAAVPPRLYGMTELPLHHPEDLLVIYEAISARNTAGTGLNDSSSRSHCFVWLTLYAHECSSGSTRISRFQFVDLAGSERLKDAHGGQADWRSGNRGTMEGMLTNFNLLMLSTCVRDLVAYRASKARRQSFSIRSYMVDLVQLLSESLMGSALTLVIVCISSAPANAQQSCHALGFGEVFSRLTIHPKPVKGKALRQLREEAEKLQESGRTNMGGGGKYATIREAQFRDASQRLCILELFDPP